ncbi:hypothetical protein ACE7GA_24330 [Roseomonas sp. CCTCC AB2023176]|uniref:hypothetical protein n=1 Tax=Roseomonas sp. CCTCC AB2023176 TaxID=3342640 RepID=UPI0035DD3CDA
MTPPSNVAVVADNPRSISAMIACLTGGPGDHLVPVFQAALANECRVVLVAAGARVPSRILEPAGPPTVVIIGADPGHDAPPGPLDFPQLARMLRWSAAVMVHAAGGMRAHYASAVDAVRCRRRVLVIETCSAREEDWIALVRAEAERRGGTMAALPTLLISARRFGGVHPAPKGRAHA